MGFGVARQCSGNRCLAPWTAWIPSWAAEAEQVERNSKKDLVTGPIPRFLCPSGSTSVLVSLEEPAIDRTTRRSNR
jgi:hypothetical protein